MGRESKRKVLYIITKSVWAGAGKYTHDLAVSLPKDRYNPIVAAGGRGAMAEKIISAGIPYFEIKGFRRDVNFLRDIRAFFEIIFLLLKTKPDIIHASSAKAGGIAGAAVFAYKVARELAKPFLKDGHSGKSSETALPIPGLKTVFTAHGWTFNEPRPGWQISLIKFFSKLTCVFYDKIICVSEYDREVALRNRIAPARKMIVVHNGIKPSDYDFLSKEKARGALAPHLAAKPPSGFWVGTIGEFTKNKGQEFLIEAAGKLSAVSRQPAYPAGGPTYSTDGPARRTDEISVVIIGFDGGEKGNLESRIKSLRLEKKVFPVDDISNAAEYLKAFDIFVLPSLKEGLPYVLLEAGLAGLPIIASRVGGIPEIIENGKSGILVEPANPDKLAAAIKTLVESEEKRRELGENAREKISKDFLFEKTLNETLTAYDDGAGSSENSDT